MINEDTAPINR